MNDKKYTVYIHLFPNGKRYIGCTRQIPERRWRCGSGYRHQKYLFSAIQEFGWESIEHVIVQDNMEQEDARKLEKELIKKYKTQDKKYGYNTKNGGQVFGEHSDEFLQNLRKRMVGNTYCVGRKLRPSHIEALRKANKGSHKPNKHKGEHIHTPETKKLLSELSQKRWEDPEYRKRCKLAHPDMHGKNNPMYGKKHSAETRAKIAQKAKGRKMSDSHKQRLKDRNSKSVYRCDMQGNAIEKYKSLEEAALSVNGNSTNVSFVCRHNGRTYKGYKWRYADEID